MVQKRMYFDLQNLYFELTLNMFFSLCNACGLAYAKKARKVNGGAAPLMHGSKAPPTPTLQNSTNFGIPPST
jgi:hypothetical protein